jgi:hypothetical protein
MQCTLDFPVCGLSVKESKLLMTSEESEKCRDLELEKMVSSAAGILFAEDVSSLRTGLLLFWWLIKVFVLDYPFISSNVATSLQHYP